MNVLRQYVVSIIWSLAWHSFPVLHSMTFQLLSHFFLSSPRSVVLQEMIGTDSHAISRILGICWICFLVLAAANSLASSSSLIFRLDGSTDPNRSPFLFFGILLWSVFPSATSVYRESDSFLNCISYTLDYGFLAQSLLTPTYSVTVIVTMAVLVVALRSLPRNFI